MRGVSDPTDVSLLVFVLANRVVFIKKSKNKQLKRKKKKRMVKKFNLQHSNIQINKKKSTNSPSISSFGREPIFYVPHLSQHRLEEVVLLYLNFFCGRLSLLTTRMIKAKYRIINVIEASILFFLGGEVRPHYPK